MTALLVVVGGAVGALSRFYTERWSVHHFGERMPWGTALANLAGAALLGAVAGLEQRGAVSHDVLVLVGTGYCGALTTFSGFIGQIENRLRHDRFDFHIILRWLTLLYRQCQCLLLFFEIFQRMFSFRRFDRLRFRRANRPLFACKTADGRVGAQPSMTSSMGWSCG